MTRFATLSNIRAKKAFQSSARNQRPLDISLPSLMRMKKTPHESYKTRERMLLQFSLYIRLDIASGRKMRSQISIKIRQNLGERSDEFMSRAGRTVRGALIGGGVAALIAAAGVWG